MQTTTLAIGVPRHDLAEFGKLPDDQKFEVLDLLKALRTAALDSRPRAVLAEVAAGNGHRRGWSMKNLERHFYKLRCGGTWRDLVNEAKTRGGGKSPWLTDKAIEKWKEYCMRHPRSYRSAYIELVADYRVGREIGDVDWRKVWANDPELKHQPMPPKCPPGMPLPDGWSYHNFMRHQPKKIEEQAASQGRQAAKSLALCVRTTRADMEPGQQYVFDDLWHDLKVRFGSIAKSVRALELACLDWASGNKIAYGIKPSRTEEFAQKRQQIRERDMRFLVAHVLCNIGFHPGGCTLLVENGTAAIREYLEKVLGILSAGPDGEPRIRVSRSGVDKKVAHLAQWGAVGGGNFKHKAALESSHNLAHNRLDHLPAPTGSNSRVNEPEELTALDRVNTGLMLASSVMPADLAKRLDFPTLDWITFSDVLAECYHQIEETHDHALEGWDRRMERQWKTHPADLWHSEEEWHALTDDQRRALTPLVAQDENNRTARKSRGQVWREGAGKLERLPDFAVAYICGKDLAETRSCPATRTVIFVNKEACPEPMEFKLGTCTGPEGEHVELQEGVVYRWLVNPFDTRAVFVLDMDGGYIGKCLRLEVANRLDMDSVRKAMGAAEKDFQEALAPLAARGRRLAIERLRQLQSNTELLRAAQPAALARSTARRLPEETGRKYNDAEVDEALATLELTMGTETKGE